MPIVSGGGGAASPIPITAGSGVPLGTVTPSKRGAVYQDTATGAIFVAYGLTNADWMQFGGPQEVSAGPVALASGVVTALHDLNGPIRGILLLSPNNTGCAVTLSDVNASNGSGNGLYWNTGFPTADGAQELHAYTGPTGDFLTVLAAPDGTMTPGTPANAAGKVPTLAQLSPRYTVTNGALSTVQLVTATGAQILTSRDAETITPCTFNPGAATTATVTVALSPDNVTYSTLAVVTEPAGVALDGTILPVKVRVPAGWYLKLTVNAQAVLGVTTYY